MIYECKRICCSLRAHNTPGSAYKIARQFNSRIVSVCWFSSMFNFARSPFPFYFLNQIRVFRSFQFLCTKMINVVNFSFRLYPRVWQISRFRTTRITRIASSNVLFYTLFTHYLHVNYADDIGVQLFVRLLTDWICSGQWKFGTVDEYLKNN